ncbi:MAG: GNAT family N-acetyltransferase [Firmicutes bacterium]|nr:GNAT family N-acetyltransferase [Bacillota bacterium]
MCDYIVRYNELTAEEFVFLWKSVWGNPPSLEQTRLAMENTLFRVSIFKENEIVAMARVIGDQGLCYYEYQGQGLGRRLIDELLTYINEHGVPGTQIAVELCAMPDKIHFYEKFGFAANEAQRLRLMYQVEDKES